MRRSHWIPPSSVTLDLVSPRRDDGADQLVRDERLHDAFPVAILRAHDDIDVADDLLPAAEAAGDLRAFHAADASDVREHRCGRTCGDGIQRFFGPVAQAVDPGEDVLLGLRPEALQLREPVRFRGSLERIDRGDLQLLIEDLHPLRPEPLDAEHVQQPRRKRLPEQLVFGRRSRAHHVGDDLGDALADPLDLREPALLRQRAEVVGDALEDSRGVVEGPGLERIRSQELQEGPHLLQVRCNLLLVGSFHDGSMRGVRIVSRVSAPGASARGRREATRGRPAPRPRASSGEERR